ncbi:YgjP-like metallopeptidase domain-containing protein [Corynebacterium lactis]|uniref:Metal-dependent hydrolase n=1 Tax=Corynebacterium lactis RW2-5 TaxID=1408189 RepID=A0A0K2GYK1_9CORY|nr:YgjP-like metallopeptidase domain-containing protein [Corynebacterium lactis]ALA66867.1 metal-dependent hydrolase [Corynebacterium lactis RW2-5]
MDKKRPDYGPDVEVRRSRRRRRTVSARAEGNRIVVMVPADMPPKAEQQQVLEIVERVRKKVGNGLDNKDLERRARTLSRTVLQNKPRFESIKWVKNMSRRWASVTGGVEKPGRIRISHRLADVPDYVLDDVIVHELVHTFVEGGHTEEFWYWASQAPHHERARGYLEAYQRWGTQS